MAKAKKSKRSQKLKKKLEAPAPVVQQPIAQPVVQQPVIQPAPALVVQPTPQPVAPAPAARPAAPAMSAANKVAGFLVGIFIVAVIFYVMGISLEDFTGNVGDCGPEPGKTFCGFCAATMQCQYCTTGYSCNFATPGDTCSSLSCGNGGGGGSTGTIASQYCNPGYCLSNGHCCPSNARYYCDGYCYDSAGANRAGCYSSFTIYC